MAVRKKIIIPPHSYYLQMLTNVKTRRVIHMLTVKTEMDHSAVTVRRDLQGMERFAKVCFQNWEVFLLNMRHLKACCR